MEVFKQYSIYTKNLIQQSKAITSIKEAINAQNSKIKSYRKLLNNNTLFYFPIRDKFIQITILLGIQITLD